MSLKVYGFSLLLLAGCSVVGVLAAMGLFNSMIGFPLVFAAICLVLGLNSLRRDPGPRIRRAAIILIGVAVAVAGWQYQMHAIRLSQEKAQKETFALLGGRPAPRLASLEPLNTEVSRLEEAVSFTSPATIVSFWATWCSPCWKEMAELQELYEEHSIDGLMILALTSYDNPESEEGREGDRMKAEKFLRKRGFEYPAAITAEGDNYRAYKVRSIPSTALVNGEGALVGYSVGLDGARDLMNQARDLVAGAGSRSSL